NNSDPSGKIYVPGVLFVGGGLTLAGLEVGGAIYGATTSCNPVQGAIVGAQNAVESPVGQVALGAATLGMMIAGSSGSSNNVVQSTGRTEPNNLNEQIAMQQVMADPSNGEELPITLNDPRWSSSDGWVKMQETVNGITIHWNLNKQTGATADYKFVNPK
ncbi:MAG: hypothetical protein ACREHC_05475, partial [Candidatus Levyibacteriota bacterium]